MISDDIIRRLVSTLEAAGVPYMVVGSIASSYHGTPRSTQDIDVVVAPTRNQLEQLLSLLPEDKYYVSPEAAYEALSRKAQFNVLDFESGWKVDLIIQKGRPFSLEEFDRRVQIEWVGTKFFVASPEDVVLAKLEWAADGESERQINDAVGILHAKGPVLDYAYLEKWVGKLALEREWLKAKKKADSIPPVPPIP